MKIRLDSDFIIRIKAYFCIWYIFKASLHQSLILDGYPVAVLRSDQQFHKADVRNHPSQDKGL